jgi:hypothetical protein
MADLDNAQRYSENEALERVYRTLRGDVLDDTPETLSGPQRPSNETISRIAELLQNSLPGETLTLPTSVMTALNNQFPDPGVAYSFGAPDGAVYLGPSGSFALQGNATVWDDLRFPSTVFAKAGSSDPGFAVFKTYVSGSHGVYLYWFDASAEEELYMVAQMPHDWKIGSVIKPHVHWVPAANGTGSVSWGLEYTWASLNQAYGTTNIIYGNTTTAGFSNVSGSISYLTPLPAITGTNQLLSSMIALRLFRNATSMAGSGDTYPNDAGLLEFDIHYEKDSLGSNEEFTK